MGNGIKINWFNYVLACVLKKDNLYAEIRQFNAICLAALALLDVQVGSLVLSIVRAVPEDLLLLSLAVSINGEPGLALVGEEALGVLTEASHAGAVGGGTGVGDSEGERLHLVGDHVEVLEGSGDGVLGGERDGAGFAVTADWRLLVLMIGVKLGLM